MDIKKYLKAMPVVAALLLTASCSNDDNEIVENPQPAQVRIIPYEASAGNGSMTRASLNSYDQYVFQTGDKLYVWGDNIYGELTLTSGADEFKATFSGNLYWSGSGDEPVAGHVLNAVIVSSNDEIFGDFSSFKARGYKPAYPTNVLAATNAEAVQMFGYFQADSYYGNHNFNFDNDQLSSFISFDITLEDGTIAGHKITATFNSGSGETAITRGGTITAAAVGTEIHAQFVAGFPGGTTLDEGGATITLGGRTPIVFGASKGLIANHIYRVTKTYTDTKRYTITASALGQNIPSTGKPMGYQTTLQDMLGTLLATSGAKATGCTKTGDGTSVDGVELGGDPYDYRFTVVGTGTTQFTVSTDLQLLPSVDFTINVVQE